MMLAHCCRTLGFVRAFVTLTFSVLTFCAMAGQDAALAAGSIDMQVKSWIQTVQGFAPPIHDPVPVNGTLIWDIQVENSNNLPAPNATLNVTLPSQFTFVSVTQDTGTCTNGPSNAVNCSFGTLAGTLVGGRPAAVHILVRPTVVGVYSVANSNSPVALVGTSGIEANTDNNSQPLPTTVVESADLTITSFVATPNPVVGGGTVSYTVAIRNLGLYTAAGAQLTFTLPPGLEYTSALGSGWNCSASAGLLTCTSAAAIDANKQAVTLTWTGKVTSNISDGTLTSLAAISSETLDSNGSNNNATASVVVKPGTDLAVTKSVSADPVIGGSTVTFTVQVDNLGPFPADTLSLTDTVPDGFTAVAAVGDGWTCLVTPLGGNAVKCDRPALAVGSAPAITITATAPSNGYIKDTLLSSATNSAQITSATTDPISGNNSGAVTFNVKLDGPDLAIHLTRGTLPVLVVPVDTDITSEISVHNLGPSAGPGPIPVTYQLAANETLVSFSGDGWSCSAVGTILTCSFEGLLAVGADTAVMTLVTKKSTSGPVASHVCTGFNAAYATDIDPGNDCTDHTVTVTAGMADLKLTKAVVTPVPAYLTVAPLNGEITYALTVTNLGGIDATDVVLTDPIPMYSAASFGRPATTVSGTWGTGGTCTGTNTLVCSLGTVAVGASTIVTVKVKRPMTDGTWTNNAYAYSQDLGDPDWTNNKASADVIIDPVTDIELTQKVANPNPVKAGVETNYNISIRNNGPSAADNVDVTDTFTNLLTSGTFTFLGATASDGGTCDDYVAPQLLCHFGTLAAGAVRSITIKIRPDYDATNITDRHLDNHAVVTTTTTQSDPDNDAKDASLGITGAEVDLLIHDVDLRDPVAFDNTQTENRIVYQIDVTNYGPSYSTGVTFNDSYTAPAGHSLTFLCDLASATADSDCSAPPAQKCAPVTTGDSSNIKCTIGDLAAGVTTKRYLVYSINEEPLASGTTFIHTVDVVSNEHETKAANNHAAEKTTARILADVEVTSKTATPGTVSLNQPFGWRILVKNKGPGTAANTTLTDTLPAGMAFTGAPVTDTGVCTVAGGSSTLNCTLGYLAKDGIATITLPVKMTAYPSGGTGHNSATVATESIDLISANDSKTGNVSVIVSSIAGTVYHDKNNDGTQSGTSEAGIKDAEVKLSGKDSYGNTVALTATTLLDGTYKFDDLSPSDSDGYTITETQPVSYLDGKDNISGSVVANSITTDVLANLALAPDTHITGYNFGELKTVSIAGLVWHDQSNDGLVDGAEATRIVSVRIDLTGTDDLGHTVTANTQTDGSGTYSFTGLRPGTYKLAETEAAGYLPGLAAAGIGATDAAGTSNNTPLTATDFGNVIDAIGLASGDTASKYNFGELKPGSLAGTVYYDTSGGATKTGQPPIAGVTLTLTGTDYRGQPVPAATTTTDAAGNYSFTNLAPGTYVLSETQPADYLDGSVQAGTPLGTVGTNDVTAIGLKSAVAGAGYDFGERSAGIAGSVFNDLNDDGIRDTGEAGFGVVTITLTGCGVSRSTSTDDSGHYLFAGLPACATGYTVTETQPTGISEGKIHPGAPGGGVASDNFTTTINSISGIKLTSTDYSTANDFGEHGRPATDLKCAVSDPGPRNIREPFDLTFTISNIGSSAAPATTVADTLPDGFELTPAATGLTAPAGTTCTPGTGSKSFNCSLGFVFKATSIDITAHVRAISYPAGGTASNTATAATEGNDTPLTNNTCLSTLTIKKSSLSGSVFDDLNDSGIQDEGEAGIKDAEVKLSGKDSYGNTVALTTTTLLDGTYKFDDLSPSDSAGYTVTETQPALFADGKDTVGDKGGTPTNDPLFDVVKEIPIGPEIDATGYNFGEIGQGLAGKVYVDSNNNGTPDAGEPGIGGVTLTITGKNENGTDVLITATTLADGSYFFPGLKPSDTAGYTLTETQPALWADGKDALGSASGTLGPDKVTKIHLPPGKISSDYNFGERGAQLCGFVYSDLDNNGLKGASEVGVPAIAVALSGNDANGQPVTRSVTTDTLTMSANAPGHYCLTDLPLSDGSGYTITETLPSTVTPGKITAGSLGGTAGADAISAILVSSVGSTGIDYNFGVIDANAASLSGYVFLDANHNRNRDDNNGRGGWSVQLVRGTLGGETSIILESAVDRRASQF